MITDERKMLLKAVGALDALIAICASQGSSFYEKEVDDADNVSEEIWEYLKNAK